MTTRTPGRTPAAPPPASPERRPRRARAAAPADAGAPAAAPSATPPPGVGASPLLYRLLGLLVLVGCVQALVMIGLEGWRVATAGREIARLEADVAELEAEAAELREVLEHGDDEAYREGLARALGWLYPEEGRVPTLRGR